MDYSFAIPCTANIKVPSGQILVNRKWQDSDLSRELRKFRPNFVFSDGLGFIDFFASELCPVVYVTECELVLGDSYKKRIKSLWETYKQRGIVVADLVEGESFSLLQEFATIDHDLTTIPVSSQAEIPQLLTQLSHVETRLPLNPFKKKRQDNEDMLRQQTEVLKCIPNVGDKHATTLLKSLGHIVGISRASEIRLSFKVGDQLAGDIHKFLNEELMLKK